MSGISEASAALVYTMAARYGLAGIFDGGRLWRAPVFVLLFVCSLLGGFRGNSHHDP